MNPLPFTLDQLSDKTKALAKAYLKEFQQPETGVLYLRPLKTKGQWTSPADVKAKKPFPWGYGSGIQDAPLHCGHMLERALPPGKEFGGETGGEVRNLLVINALHLYAALRGGREGR